MIAIGFFQIAIGNLNFFPDCTVFLSFLKRESERFPLFVPMRSTLQPFTVLESCIEVPWPFRQRLWTFYDRFRTFHQLFRPFVTFLWTEKLRFSHETFWNGQERWTFRNDEPFLDGLKSLQNQFHGTFRFALQIRKKFCIIF